jgi:hypothetical protein
MQRAPTGKENHHHSKKQKSSPVETVNQPRGFVLLPHRQPLSPDKTPQRHTHRLDKTFIGRNVGYKTEQTTHCRFHKLPSAASMPNKERQRYGLKTIDFTDTHRYVNPIHHYVGCGGSPRTKRFSRGCDTPTFINLFKLSLVRQK